MTGPGDDRDPSGRFIRGLTIGALLGAIVAGSSAWSRLRARRHPVKPAAASRLDVGTSATPGRDVDTPGAGD